MARARNLLKNSCNCTGYWNNPTTRSHPDNKSIKNVHMIRNILYRAILTLKRLMPASRIAMHMIYLNQFFCAGREREGKKHSCIVKL